MDVFDEHQARKKREKSEFLDENFEDPEHSDVLVEKQVKERKRKK